MYILEPDEMKKVDLHAINDLGTDEAFLMMNAAKAVLEEIKKVKGKSVSVFAGKGNNGADALILADLLIRNGYVTKIFLLADRDDMTGSAREMLDSLRAENAEMEKYSECSTVCADIVADGMFGTGFKGKLPELYKDAIDKINRSGAFVAAIDIPSGLDGKTGIILETSVKADLTVSFGAAKTGFFLNDGPDVIGKLVVRDIGFPPDAYSVTDKKRYLVDSEMIRRFYRPRKRDSNKGDFGRTLIIAGSESMPGAGILCCKAAYRTGSGYVYYMTDRHNISAYAVAVPEAIYMKDLDLKNIDSVAIGPGLGIGDGTEDLVKEVLRHEDINVILDADALNSIRDPDMLKHTGARILITPHPKELSGLTGISTEDIRKDRMEISRCFAMEHKAVTLLKGPNTVISDEEGNIYINTTGNSSLAKAGTGDVLTGIIAGFAAHSDLLEASIMSAYLHGYCADIFIRENSHFSLMASEIVDRLPKAMAENGIL
jgi:ADP-dependent NAD(P)H-hydrate dehydratase / NAD(P)H-hydrate epimerase